MDVVLRRFGVIGGRAVRNVAVPDETKLFKQFQGSVDGGDVDRARLLMHLREDLIWSGVSKLLHGRQNQLPLRRQPVAALSKHLLPLAGTHQTSVELSGFG